MVTASEGVLVMLEGEEGDLMEVHVLGRDGDGGVALAWDVGLWVWPEVWGRGCIGTGWCINLSVGRQGSPWQVVYRLPEYRGLGS